MSLVQIKVGGFGGQGVILAGMILGEAAAIFDNKSATMTRSYGPEARGGACSAQIVLSDKIITYPYVTKADILIAMSQEACDRFSADLKEDGILIYESGLVKPKAEGKKFKLVGVPALQIAEELGNRMTQNIVMLGGFAKACDGISKEALKDAIKANVPSKTIDLNLNAFEKGYASEA